MDVVVETVLGSQVGVGGIGMFTDTTGFRPMAISPAVHRTGIDFRGWSPIRTWLFLEVGPPPTQIGEFAFWLPGKAAKNYQPGSNRRRWHGGLLCPPVSRFGSEVRVRFCFGPKGGTKTLKLCIFFVGGGCVFLFLFYFFIFSFFFPLI